jgi:hypothetical protein
MLKIKQNVDLKELEKYGFELTTRYKCNFYEKTSKENIELTYYIDIEFRNITVATYDGDEVELDNTLYDLIKADLVEKVE